MRRKFPENPPAKAENYNLTTYDAAYANNYLKANASGIIREFGSGGEAKAVLIDIETYDMYQESMAMLKIISQSKASLREGKVKPAKKAIEDIKNNTNLFKI